VRWTSESGANIYPAENWGRTRMGVVKHIVVLGWPLFELKVKALYGSLKEILRFASFVLYLSATKIQSERSFFENK
jgi:hypothetical protein